MMYRPAIRRVITIVVALMALVPALASAQDGVATGTITVTGIGEAVAPADMATISLTISTDGMMGPLPLTGPSARDQVEPIVAGLEDAGIGAGTIEVITGPNVGMSGTYYGPAIAIIRFDIPVPTADRITEAVDVATAAATGARLYIGGMSVRLTSDQCPALEREAREAAVADARARAEGMGELTGLTPGEALAVREVPPGAESAFIYQDPLVTGCAPVELPTLGWEMYGPASAYDPTEEPVVRVYAQVEMTFAASPSVLATPSG